MIKRTILSIFALSLLAMAQSFNPPQLIWSGPLATSTSQCLTPAAGSASICPVLSGGVVSYFAWNGTAWIDLAATSAPVAAVLTVNGKKPDSTGNISLSAVTTTTVVAPTATSTTALQ